MGCGRRRLQQLVGSWGRHLDAPARDARAGHSTLLTTTPDEESRAAGAGASSVEYACFHLGLVTDPAFGAYPGQVPSHVKGEIGQ